MGLTKATNKKIEVAIDNFSCYLRYKSVGPHVLTKDQLTRLVRAGYINSSEVPRTAVIEAYSKTLALASDAATVTPKIMRTGAIEFLERMFDAYSKKAGEGFKTDIMGTLESHLAPMFDRREGKDIFEVLKDPKVHSKNLGASLRGVVDNWEVRWKTIVTTELNRASNFGSMDAIITNNPDKQPNEITAYKIGRVDNSLCKYCKEFWYTSDGVTPKTYKMSELMANGSNIGKKAKDWAPTIDSTHPNCRHILHELKPGWGFKGGKLEYVGKDHDEHTHQSK